MNVKVEDVSSIRKRLSFEIAPDRVDSEIAAAYKQIAKTAKVKGFRAGKIPQKVLEKYYEPQMQEKVFTRLINDTYFKALVEHKIAAVSDPQITESGSLEKGQTFTYAAEVEVKPEVEVKDYTGLSLQKEKFVEDAGVADRKLEELQSSRSELKVTTRKKAREGDFVVIDFQGFVDGEAFEGGSADGHVLELGSGSFIPGFEEQVVGMKREDQKDVEVTFPAEYGSKELAGKPAVFKVTLHEIKEKVNPDLDDEFAKGFGAESLEELKQKLEENHHQQEKSRIESDLKERLMSALIERNPLEVPETMVEQQLDYMLENVRNRMQAQGMSLEMLGMNEDSFRQMYHGSAVTQVQGGLLLEAVAKQEDVSVADDEVDGKLEQIAEMANAPLEAVKSYYGREENRSQLMNQIVEEKVIALLLDKAKIKEVAKEKLQAEADAADKKKSTDKEK